MSDYRFSRLLKVSSTDATFTDPVTGFKTYNTNDNDLHQIRRIMLKAAYVPNTQYNINIYNNVLAMTGSIIGAYTLTVPVGQYTTTNRPRWAIYYDRPFNLHKRPGPTCKRHLSPFPEYRQPAPYMGRTRRSIYHYPRGP
jgi:hypothetical protein